LIKFKNNHW